MIQTGKAEKKKTRQDSFCCFCKLLLSRLHRGMCGYETEAAQCKRTGKNLIHEVKTLQLPVNFWRKFRYTQWSYRDNDNLFIYIAGPVDTIKILPNMERILRDSAFRFHHETSLWQIRLRYPSSHGERGWVMPWTGHQSYGATYKSKIQNIGKARACSIKLYTELTRIH